MKKQLFRPVLMVLVLLCAGCVTKRRHGSWNDYPGVPFFYTYKIAGTSVTIDHVREDTLAEQLFMIAETYLESRQDYGRGAGRVLLLDITVEQRSFMQNVELYNSIYVSCVARDEDGKIYARENEYISGKQTFVAAAEQSAIIRRLIGRLLTRQKQRDKDIQKYEKEAAKGT
jgi:hypothetical protein